MITLKSSVGPRPAQRAALMTKWTSLAVLLVFALGLSQASRVDEKISSVASSPSRTDAPRELDETSKDQDSNGVEPHPIDQVIVVGRQCEEALQKVDDYTAVLTKTELVGDKLIRQTMDIKFRNEPFSVYLRYTSDREAGREVIYVEGANDDQMLVRESGLRSLAGNLKLPTDDPKVLKENRYPINEIGMGKLLETAFDVWKGDANARRPSSKSTWPRTPAWLRCRA